MSLKQRLFSVLAAVLIMPSAVYAQLGTDDSGLKETIKEGYGISDANIMSLPEFIGAYIIKPILGLTGTIIFALMAYAGFLWMTAGGEEKRVSKAKAILSQCVVGLVILVGSYALANRLIGVFA